MQDINEYVMNRLNAKTNIERRPSSWPKLNQLLFDLGSDTEKEEDVNYVKQKITELDKQFDLGWYLFNIIVVYVPYNILMVS